LFHIVEPCIGWKIVPFSGAEQSAARLGFGCASLMQLPSQRQRQRLLEEAFEQGLRHFDVARMYGLGRAEHELGRFARSRRDQVSIGTKFGIEASASGMMARLQAPARAAIGRVPALREALKRRSGAFELPRRYDAATARASLELSLEALGTDYVDFLFVHDPTSSDLVDMEELRSTLEELRQAGYVRAWGVSGDPDPCLGLARSAGAPAVLQVRDDIFDPAPIVGAEAPAITFGVLSSALGRIHNCLVADPEMRSRWSTLVGRDCGDPETLAALLLQDALERNPDGMVLFGTTRPPRLASALHAAEEISGDREALQAFRCCLGEDLASSPGDMEETIEADVAVVGAGPAGIVVGLELARAGHDVVLIESGGTRFDPKTQRLGDAVDGDPHHVELSLATRRQVGGASNLWGGRCVPFDPIDFEPRPIVGEARWPVAYGDVSPYLQRACDWCRCGEAVFDAGRVPELAGHSIVPGFVDGDVRATELERWSLPTNFGRVYREDLERTPNLRLETGLTCTEIVAREEGEDGSRGVEHLLARRRDGGNVEIRARRYVIAAGGLGATRLLFASNARDPGGIGNHSDHLGRWYMAHVEVRVGKVRFTTPPEQTIYGHERDRDGVYVRRRFTLSEQLQRDRRLPNVAFWLVNPEIGDASHGSGILSFVYLMLISPLGRYFVAEGIRQAHIKTSRPPTVRAHLHNVLRDLGPATAFAIAFGYRRFLHRGRKVPGFFVRSADNSYPLLYHGEHLPHAESRVEPVEERDAYGMPRLRTHLHFDEEDVASVRRAHEELDTALRAQGLGRVEFLREDVEEAVREQLFGGYHQAGTTRMSRDSEDGVVDGNLAVHGFGDLFVASSSTFPTSSQANSTFMLVAMATRLADRLAAELTVKPQPEMELAR
jgi:choline dehydrogenase-like flavoprotein